MQATVLYEDETIKFTQSNFGWVKVRYKNVGRDVTVSIRPKKAKELIATPKGRYATVGGKFYTYWTTSTKAGAEYTAKRQVQGLLKAVSQNAPYMVPILQEVLKHNAKYVQKWWQDFSKRTPEWQMEYYYKGGSPLLSDEDDPANYIFEGDIE